MKRAALGEMRFGKYAKELLRHRKMLAVALMMALVSAGSMGAGLLAIPVVLENVLGDDGRTLPELAAGLHETLAGWGVSLPQGLVESLPEGQFNAVLVMMVVLGGLTVFGAGANFLHAYLSFTLSIRSVAGIRRRAYHHLLRAPMERIVSGRPIDMVSRVISDTNVLGSGFQALTNKALAQVTKGAASLVAAFVIEWRISLATLVIAPLLLTIIRKLAKTVRRATRGAMRSSADLLDTASHAMLGFRLVKVFCAEAHELGRFTQVNETLVREQTRARLARALSSPLTEAVSIVALGAIVVVAAKAVIDGDLEKGSLLGALGALAFAGNSIKPLSAVVQEIQAAEAASQRLDDVFDQPTEVQRAQEQGKAARQRLPHHVESLAFEDVTYAYPGAEDNSLTGVSVRIEQGMRVAFVGPNGSGKTTLLAMVPQLLSPTSGKVLIDGVDIAGVTTRSLRKQIAVVTQEATLFPGTIADNIAFGTRDTSREDVVQAAKLAHADTFIEALPDGYDAAVGSQGQTLSGGQRQRIAIARALLRDPAILILDEATSMIDTQSETQINQAIEASSQGRTTLVIAHRLSTIQNADMICVLEAGKLVGAGTHAELLDSCQTYRDLVDAKQTAAP